MNNELYFIHGPMTVCFISWSKHTYHAFVSLWISTLLNATRPAEVESVQECMAAVWSLCLDKLHIWRLSCLFSKFCFRWGLALQALLELDFGYFIQQKQNKQKAKLFYMRAPFLFVVVFNWDWMTGLPAPLWNIIVSFRWLNHLCRQWKTKSHLCTCRQD